MDDHSRFLVGYGMHASASSALGLEVLRAAIASYGPPLVMKSDNGSQFRAEETKRLLAEYRVAPLFSPKRCPQYNGGVERANRQLASYQESSAQSHQRSAGPTREDAALAIQLANQLARTHGWRGPTTAELWAGRASLASIERDAFLAAVEQQRAVVHTQWNFAPDQVLIHDQTAAVDRRAVRDVLVAHDLLRIHPRRKSRRRKNAAAKWKV